jgi:hypothetical protein
LATLAQWLSISSATRLTLPHGKKMVPLAAKKTDERSIALIADWPWRLVQPGRIVTAAPPATSPATTQAH